MDKESQEIVEPKTKVFELKRMFEIEAHAKQEIFTLRIDVFEHVANKNRFRVRIWHEEFFRIQSTFPQDKATGNPLDEPSDENLFVDFEHNLKEHYSDFYADSSDAAFDRVFQDISRFVAALI